MNHIRRRPLTRDNNLSTAVSYTHLVGNQIHFPSVPRPVSYTHLDVYKRQSVDTGPCNKCGIHYCSNYE